MSRPTAARQRWPTGRRGLLAALPFATACAGEATGVAVDVVIEVPATGSDGDPWPGLTDLDLSVVRGSDGVVVQSASAPLGTPLGLIDVDFGTDLVLELSGRDGEIETAYGRTCAFAVDPDAEAPGLHLYFARIVKWAAGPSPAAPGRTGGQAYTTTDGRAVFVGGGADVERFDPQDGSFHEVALAARPRDRSALVALADGRALLIGGVDGGGDGVPFVEVLDPRPETPAGGGLESQEGPRLVEHAATALVDGDVLVAGGLAQVAATEPFAASRDAYLIHFGDGGVLEPPVRISEPMTVARASHTATRLGGEVGADVLLVGGQSETGLPVAQAELYRPLRGVFETVGEALLNSPRWGHVAVRLPGGFVLVVGGLTVDPEGGAPLPVDTVELYDPVQGRFSIAGRLPPRAGVVELSVTPLPDGRVLLAGGRAADGQPVDTVLIAAFDPLTGQVTLSSTDRMETPRAGHAAARLCDGTILVVGGATETEAPGSERYDPPSAVRR